MKKIVCFVISVVMLVSLCSCGAKVNEDGDKDVSMFVSVERTTVWQIVYHRETKVMYAVSLYGHGSGTFTLLVNQDGTPMIWAE